MEVLFQIRGLEGDQEGALEVLDDSVFLPHLLIHCSLPLPLLRLNFPQTPYCLPPPPPPHLRPQCQQTGLTSSVLFPQSPHSLASQMEGDQEVGLGEEG